jgi:hypothetical protein
LHVFRFPLASANQAALRRRLKAHRLKIASCMSPRILCETG